MRRLGEERLLWVAKPATLKRGRTHSPTGLAWATPIEQGTLGLLTTQLVMMIVKELLGWGSSRCCCGRPKLVHEGGCRGLLWLILLLLLL